MKRLIGLSNESPALVTSLGATIALGIFGLKSSQAHLANKLAIPQSEYLLDFYRPHQILIRVISRSMIMWSDISPAISWVEDNVPGYIRNSVDGWLHNGEHLPVDSHIFHCYLNIICGLCYSIALKYAGTCNLSGFNTLIAVIDIVSRSVVASSSQLSYSGKLSRLIGIRCLNGLSTSLSLIMAGSGNLSSLEKLISIGKLMPADGDYGASMAFHISIGLLFLGGGTNTIGNSDKAIACVFCSLFPIYQSRVTDNRFHLQALRHLWVLAVEQRCLITRNAVSNEIEAVPMEVTLKKNEFGHQPQKLTGYTPFMLPSFNCIESINILGPRFWPQSHEFGNLKPSSYRPFTIWAQRKTKHLSYMSDPDGRRGILGASFPIDGADFEQVLRARQRFVKSFSSDPKVVSFLTYFCDSEKGDGQSSAVFCLRLLYECLTQDKPEVIGVVLWIMNTVKDLRKEYANPEDILNLKLILSAGNRSSQSVINPDFLSHVDHQIHCVWKSSITSKSSLFFGLLDYIKTGNISGRTNNEMAFLNSFLAYNEWPKNSEMQLIKHLFMDENRKRNQNALFLEARKISKLTRGTFHQIIELLDSAKH